MQRIAAFLIILFTALNSGCATSTKPAPVSEGRPIAALAPSAPTPAVSTPEVEIPVATTFPLVVTLPEALTTPPKEDQKSHIALLLPLKSASFGPAAEAVRRGAIAASGLQTPAVLPLQVYPTGDPAEDIVSVYQQALQAGAKIVIGPLTVMPSLRWQKAIWSGCQRWP